MDTVSPQHWESEIFPYYYISTQVNDVIIIAVCNLFMHNMDIHT